MFPVDSPIISRLERRTLVPIECLALTHSEPTSICSCFVCMLSVFLSWQHSFYILLKIINSLNLEDCVHVWYNWTIWYTFSSTKPDNQPCHHIFIGIRFFKENHLYVQYTLAQMLCHHFLAIRVTTFITWYYLTTFPAVSARRVDCWQWCCQIYLDIWM